MNTVKLRYVVAVERQGSISAAARALNVTQSAVTKAVADVEEELGTALFDRHARGVSVTAAGRAFIDRAARILSDMDQLVSDVAEGRQARDQVLRIGVAPSSLEGLLARAVWALLGDHPELRLHLRGAPFEAGLQLFRQGDLDLLIGPARPLGAEPGVRVEPIPPLRALLFGRKGHPLAGRRLGPGEIAAYPLIVPEPSGPYAEPIAEVMRQMEGDPVRRIHILESFTMAAGVIERSEALGVVVDSYAESRNFRNRFEVLGFDMRAPLPMAMAYRSDRQHSRALRWFRAAVQKHPPTAGAGVG